MTPNFKLQQISINLFLKVIVAISLLPTICLANQIMATDLLQEQSFNKKALTATKMVMFQQAASGETDATSISKITLAYFTSNNCTGNKSGSGFYTTPNGTSFSISVGDPFGITAAGAWNTGSTYLSIADMTTIQSIAVTFKSTNNNTPQTNFSGFSYACIPVTCTAGPSGECTSASGTQSFTLKTTAAVGDPADGGVIGCQNTGASFNLFDIVVTTSDNSIGLGWGGLGTTTGATSTTNGDSNTTTIVACLTGPGGGGGCPQNITLNTYAAGLCSNYSAAGGYTSNWFLPSGSVTNSQLNCLYNNRTAIATGSTAAGGSGFAASQYWSSTEASSNNAWFLNFSNASQISTTKSLARRVRCTRAF